MKKPALRSISILVLLALICSMLVVPVSAFSWDNVSETRYASRYQTSNYTTGKFYENMTRIPLTGDGARDVVAVAASQMGYIEGSSASGYNGEVGGSNNYTEYGCFLGLTGGSGHAWCAAFCAWCFYTAEVTDVDGSVYDTGYDNIWADAYVPYWSTYLIEQGRYKYAEQFRSSYDPSQEFYIPQPGDLVFFYTASGDYPGWEGHIGLVAYSDGTYVYTLEGNTSSQDGVESEGGGAFLKKYSLTSNSLVGFGVMPYETVAGLPEIDYTGENPTPGLYVTTSGAKSVYQSINDSTASWTLPMSSVFEVLEISNDSDGNVMLYSKCEIDGSTVYGWITHGSDSNGYTKTLQVYASPTVYDSSIDQDRDGIPDSYGVSIDEEGIYSFDNAYGYEFDIDDINGTIDGEDATIITTASAYESCNPNWAISVQLRPTGNTNEYQVVKVVETPGSAAAADITLESGDIILVVHSAASYPGTYANWMSKVAALALKTGDIIAIASDNKSATVVSAGETVEPTEPEVTEPEVTEPEVTEPEVTEPEVTEPEVTEPEETEPEETEPEETEPEVILPDYSGAIPGAGIPGSADNLYYGCDVSFYNVNDTSYANYTTSDDSAADYSLLDFQKMKADGCDFVILRMGSSDSSGYYYDPHFVTLYNMAREAGLDIGMYFYSYALTYAEAVAEAEYCIDVIEDLGMYFEYPVYIDIEESDQLALSESELTNVCYGWCETMVDAGYFPGIYGNYNLYDGISTDVKNDYDFWLAWVSSATSTSAYNPSAYNLSDECGMWQYSFYGYEYDGVGLDMLDVNVSYKDYPAIMAKYGYNNIDGSGSDNDQDDNDDGNDQVDDGIPDSYGAYVDEDGIYVFDNAYGYVFDIDDVNGTIDGEDATIVTSSSYYSSCNPNWAISVQLRPTGNTDEYKVVKVVETPGSASAADISWVSGDVVMVVHSAASYPGDYENWMSKVAAVALKEGDVVNIASDNSTVTVISAGEPVVDPDADGDGIPDSYGVSVDEDGIYVFDNAYGYVFDIDDVNGTIDGEDATIVTSASYYSSCNPNWAISVQLRPTGNTDEYKVVKVVETPGSASAANISLQTDDVIMVVHSAASYPGDYENWMSKVAAVALKEGDVVNIASDNTTVTVISEGEPFESEETEEPEVPETTEPEVTEPEVTEPEATEPEATEPEVYEGLQEAGIPGYADNLYYGCDVSFYNVNDTSYANYTTSDDSAADYSLLDFERMKADGCDFVILRMGSEDSSGRYYDPHFVTLYNMAREAGMDIGLYYYSYAMTYDEAVADAEYCIDVIEDFGMYFEYPVYIDIEESDQLALAESELSDICYGWCDTMVDAGYFPGIYGSYKLYDGVSTDLKNTYDFWVAWVSSATEASAYNPSTNNISNECAMWQYSWYGYEYDGVGLDMLDVNVSYKDYPAIMAKYGYNNVVA